MNILPNVKFVESENVGGDLINPSIIVAHYTVTRDANSALSVLTKNMSNKTFGMNLIQNEGKLSVPSFKNNIVTGYYDGVVYFNKEGNSTDEGFSASAIPRVSAHLLIDKDGTVYQLVPFNKVAWHAGQSSYNGVSNCNTFSIGIELVNIGPIINGKDVYGRVYGDPVLSGLKFGPWSSWAQYPIRQIDSFVNVCRKITAAHPSIKNIVSHSDIAPGRKFDAGPAFPMSEVRQKIFTESKTIVGENDLNLRSGPGGGTTIYANMKPGCELKITDSEGDWVKVNISGWCHSKYVKHT